MLNSFPTNSGEEVQKFRTFYACIIGSWPLYACFFLSVVRTSNFKKDFRPAYAFFCGHFMVALTLCVNASKPWPFGRIIPVFCIGHFMPVFLARSRNLGDRRHDYLRGRGKTEMDHAVVLTEAMPWKRDNAEARTRPENFHALKIKNGTLI